MSLKKFVGIFFIIVIFAILILASFLRYSIVQGKTFIQPAFSKPLLSSYKPKTGDILAVHYLGHGMIGIPVAEHWPTHAGMIWVKPDGKAVVVECTKFSAPALPNLFKQTLDKTRGVRIVPWDEYVNSVDNVLYIRQLIEGSIDSYEVEDILNTWAFDIDFETRIADSMTIDLTVAIGFVPVWPRLSQWCAETAKLHEVKRRQKQAFCSEFVVQLLQKLEGINQNAKNLYKVSPASLLKTAGVLDHLAIGSPRNCKWGEDRMIVRRA